MKELRKGLFSCFLAGLCILFFTDTTKAATFCVSTPGELQGALTTATSNLQDDTIHIVQGTYVGNFVYVPDPGLEPFNLTIEGGYTAGCASRTVDPGNTVLDGNQEGRVLVFLCDYPVIFEVDGLTIQNGYNIQYGGGLYAYMAHKQGTVTLRNNTISNNTADSNGGGVYIYNAGRVTLTNSTISNNTADSNGGGVYINRVFAAATLTNNMISNNTAGSEGGGVCLCNASLVTLTNNMISNNSADMDGGGVHLYSHVIDSITNNTISNNTAFSNGGGVNLYYEGTVTLTNNTISNNTADSNGGGIWLWLMTNFDSADIYNNIIWNNSAGEEGNDLYIDKDLDGYYLPYVINFFNNDFDQSVSGTYLNLPYTLYSSNLDNIDPLFVNTFSGDYHLQVGSPCINTGFNDALQLPDTDMDGEPRIMDGVVDIGADEYSETAATSAEFSANPTSGNAPLEVTFTDESTGQITSWGWDFGDGGTSAEQNPTHTYYEPGSYTVSLTVMGPNGSDTKTKVDYITVTLVEPIPDIKVNGSDGPLFVAPGENVNITVSLDPGGMAGSMVDCWIGAMTPYGTFWIFAQPIALFELSETSLLDRTLPVGIYTFFFVLDNNPNGIFDNMTWHDYVVVIVSSVALGDQMQTLPDFEALFQEKVKELMSE